MSSDRAETDVQSTSLDTDVQPKADLAIFENLGEAYSGTGRAQLNGDQRDGFAMPLSDAAGIPRGHIDIRTLNDEKQTRRALSESTFSRVQSDVEMLDWVFVGRCTGVEETYPKILTYMAENVHVLAGISVFIGAQPDWQVIGMYYDPELEEKAKKVAERLGYDFTDANVISVRDRRNLTKNLSDYDDPLSSDVFLTSTARSEIISEMMRKKCVAIQGPPGTGKTVVSKSIALEVAGDSARVLPLQFHQSYSYEDFVRGWRPSESGKLELRDGAFLKLCEVARHDPGNPYVVLLDEINRANVSLVFGEVLSLIEATKRDAKFAVDLAYGGGADEGRFFVPKNLFLIATMNTADRSLALVDYALRRRFSFIDLLPAYGDDEFLNFVSKNGVPRVLAEEISRRMNLLNSVISNDRRNLGPGFAVGHSYFCGKPKEDGDLENWYMNIVDHEIAPLLKEYWSEEEELAEEQISLLARRLTENTSSEVHPA